MTAAAARRVALAAQGFGVPRPAGTITMRHIQRVIDTVGILQIDSVNVLSRSHYLPVFSRLGPYSRALLDRAASVAPRRVVEYWAHEASYIPPATHRLLRWRMDRAADEAWGGMIRIAHDRADLIERVLEAVHQHGPITAGRLDALIEDDADRERNGEWGWNWSDVKRAVEFLFWSGRITSAGRTQQFERRYAPLHKVLPATIINAPDPDPEDARRQLIMIAAKALGVASERCLRDYFRLRPAESRSAITDLVDDGQLIPVEVDGWGRQAYLHPDARRPRRIEANALLSPFDSLIWDRNRTEDLWGYRFRLEIYTPAAKRIHGYYVLSFLMGERIAARVDLKSDRRGGGGGLLQVKAAWAEPDHHDGGVATALAAELEELARFLELDGVQVLPAGDLAPALSKALAG
jgi:uncharacterized protein YcaQ